MFSGWRISPIGRFSGIVDLDTIAFGDRLYFIALTRMPLLKSDYDTDYIDYLVSYFDLNPEQKSVSDFYTLLFCVDFMSEIGQMYNKDELLSISSVEKGRVESLYRQLIESIV